ncbi:hypothetical protein AZ248_14505 [Mycobacterium tuberculosis variant africanum]|nr:hypothetical protein AZ248_14505 [Mycobacterium tuberculosis variant africanum]
MAMNVVAFAPRIKHVFDVFRSREGTRSGWAFAPEVRLQPKRVGGVVYRFARATRFDQMFGYRTHE